MTKNEIKAALDLAGVAYAKKANLETLQALYAEHVLPTLGEYGLGSNDEDAKCPHCGINHKDNGWQTPEGYEGATNEHICLGCGGQWGPAVVRSQPTGTGLKIEKDRPEQNGIKRPSIGGKCRAIWDALDAYRAETGELPASKTVKELAADEGWNPNNASIEFYQWRKFHGISKSK